MRAPSNPLSHRHLCHKKYQPDLGETKLLHCCLHHALQSPCPTMLLLDPLTSIYKPTSTKEPVIIRLIMVKFNMIKKSKGRIESLIS